METRELFERVVADEPPLSVSAPAVTARGRAAARRRWVGSGTGALAVAAVVAVGAVQIGHQHSDARPSGVGPTPSAAPSAAFASLPFSSPAQITAANARVYALLVAQAGGAAALIKGSPLSFGGPVSHDTSVVATQVQYPVGADSGILQIMTSKPNNFTATDGVYVISPCSLQSLSVQWVDCVRAALPGGGYVWTYSSRRASDHATFSRGAVLVTADGSWMGLAAYVNKGHEVRDQVQATPSQVLPGAAELSQLIQEAALSWEGRGGLLAPLAGPGVAVPTSSSSPIADSGPDLGASLAFNSAGQIKAANDSEYSGLLPVGGGADALTYAKPLWDTAPITDGTAFVADQIEYPAIGGTAMLRTTTSDAADAKTRYNGLLSGALCPQLKSNADKSFANCVEKAVAGATLYTFETVEAYAGANTGREQNSPAGPATYERDAILVTKDGSALDVVYQLQGTNGMPLPLTSSLGMSDSDLGVLAVDAARAWQFVGPNAPGPGGVASWSSEPPSSSP
jgi:hypothetical protein